MNVIKKNNYNSNTKAISKEGVLGLIFGIIIGVIIILSLHLLYIFGHYYPMYTWPHVTIVYRQNPSSTNKRIFYNFSSCKFTKIYK